VEVTISCLCKLCHSIFDIYGRTTKNNNMKKIFTLALIALSTISFTQAQQRTQGQGQNGPRPGTTPPAAAATAARDESARMPATASRTIVTEGSVVTNHTVTIRGKAVPYKATTGTLPVWDEDGKPIAGLFYTYYERSDVQNRDSRPLVISFNGGPGSASVWMHILAL
jgi:carboxypeptidase C (cathepsin A)